MAAAAQPAKPGDMETLERNVEAAMKPLLSDAKKQGQSGFTSYSPEVQNTIKELEMLGFEEFAFPEAVSHVPAQNFAKIFAEAEKSGDPSRVREVTRKFVEDQVRYVSPNIKPEQTVFIRNDSFQNAVNYLGSRRPQENVALTVRLGPNSDEIGAVIWDAPSQKMALFRFDVHNLGAVSAQHGRDAGNQVVDGQISIVSKMIEDAAQRPGSLEEKIAFLNKALPQAVEENLSGKGFAITKDYSIAKDELTLRNPRVRGHQDSIRLLVDKRPANCAVTLDNFDKPDIMSRENFTAGDPSQAWASD